MHSDVKIQKMKDALLTLEREFVDNKQYEAAIAILNFVHRSDSCSLIRLYDIIVKA